MYHLGNPPISTLIYTVVYMKGWLYKDAEKGFPLSTRNYAQDQDFTVLKTEN